MTDAKLHRLRIGQLARQVGVEQFVIRFWEKEFDLTCKRSQGGQRFYTSTDVERFKKIRELLYEKKFTIEGARSVLSGTIPEATILPSIRVVEKDERKEFIEQLQNLKQQLIKLRSFL